MPRQPGVTIEGNRKPLGYRQQSITTAAAITSIPNGASAALVIVEGDVRWRDDGTDPTASAGMPLLTNGFMWYYGNNMAALKFVSVSGSGVNVNVAFYD